MEDTALSLKWDNQKKTFFENLKILREKPNYTDATLAVEGKYYPVHKLVMSTCSDYFSDIFDRTPCRSPVIVLKDVQSHDVEALLDYMYLGEVNVNQNDLASLLKTAECLKIKGLALPDEDPTKLHKNLTSSYDVRQGSLPHKRQLYDSNIITPCGDSSVSSPQMSATTLVNPVQTPSIIRLNFKIPPQSNSNTSNSVNDEPPDLKFEMEDEKFEIEDEPLVVKVEVNDVEEQVERFRRGNNCEGGASIDQDPGGDYGSDIVKTNSLLYAKLMHKIPCHECRVGCNAPIECPICNEHIHLSCNLKPHLQIYHSKFLLFHTKEVKDAMYTTLSYSYADILHKDLSLSTELIKNDKNLTDIASLLKTPESLGNNGITLPDEDPSELFKKSTTSHNNVHQDSPPPKRQRHGSNTITPHAASPVPSPQNCANSLAHLVQTPDSNIIIPHAASPVPSPQKSATSLVHLVQTPSDSYTITPHAASPVPSPQMCATSLVHLVQTPSDSNIITPCAASPGPYSQKSGTALVNPVQTPSIIRLNFKIPPHSNTSNTEQDEPPDVKFEMEDKPPDVIFKMEDEKFKMEDEPLVVNVEVDDAEEQKERYRTENNWEGCASSDQDSGGDDGSDIVKTNDLRYAKLMKRMPCQKFRVAPNAPINCPICNKCIPKSSRNMKSHLQTMHANFLLFRAKEEGIKTDVLHTALQYTYVDIMHKDLSLSTELIQNYNKYNWGTTVKIRNKKKTKPFRIRVLAPITDIK